MANKKSFNTSGPNVLARHYTLMRPALMAEGKELVHNDRYFTLFAPRQSGKSTFFQLLGKELEQEGYQVCYNNLGEYRTASLGAFLGALRQQMQQDWQITVPDSEIATLFKYLSGVKDKKLVLIIDEVEAINPDYLGTFLHAIRSIYHTRSQHSLKSVILVGVQNMTGEIEKFASPFNTNEELQVPYFTPEEIRELLGQHETATGQLFSEKVKERIIYMTAGQPGLINGFAASLVKKFPNVPVFEYEHYLQVEQSYTHLDINKNVANIVAKAKQERKFIERLLFDDTNVPFMIHDERIKMLYVNGVINHDENKNIIFGVPLYRKCLHAAFSAPLNGESKEIRKISSYKIISTMKKG